MANRSAPNPNRPRQNFVARSTPASPREEGLGAGVQLARRPARGLRGLHRAARSTRAGALCRDCTTMAASPAARWSGRRCSACSPTSSAGKIDVVVVYKVDRLTRSLADFAKIVEVFDAQRRLLRLGHPAVQHHDLDGAADAQRPALLRPVRARGHRRAHPRQDRGLQEEGHVDGRPAAARLRRQGPQARRQRGRGRDGPAYLPPLSRARLGPAAEGRARRRRRRQQACERRPTAARYGGKPFAAARST